MIKKMKHDNTCVITLIVFYDNSKSLIFKVLVVVVYFFLYKYFCVDYLCLKNNKKCLLHTNGLNTLSVLSFQEVAFPKFCQILCLVVVFPKKTLQH